MLDFEFCGFIINSCLILLFARRIFRSFIFGVGRSSLISDWCMSPRLWHHQQIAWLKVDTQTILSIQTHIITKNHRMSVTHAENRAWVLRIKDVRELDKGWWVPQFDSHLSNENLNSISFSCISYRYMCQVNTGRVTDILQIYDWFISTRLSISRPTQIQWRIK